MPSERYATISTRLGHAAVIGGEAGLIAVILPGLSRAALVAEVKRRHPEAVAGERGLVTILRAVGRYFETGRPPSRLPRMDLRAVGPFREAVYRELMKVPAGETLTYKELARRIGREGAHRAVGTAVSRNPIPLFIPCHRVIRSDGGLGGFTAEGGIELKQAMLDLEAGEE